MKNCQHKNTAAASAIATAAVWCRDCKRWVRLKEPTVSLGSRPVMSGTQEKNTDTGKVSEPLTTDKSDFPHDLGE